MKSGYESGYKTRRHCDIASSGAGLPAQLPFNVRVRSRRNGARFTLAEALTDRVPTKRIYQYGPNCVRDSRDLRAALAIIAERGQARLEADERWRYAAINPALLAYRE